MRNKSILDTFYTGSFNWTYDTHGIGAVAIAAERIAKGETIGFECYNRRNENDSTEMTLEAISFFGIVDLEGRPAFRKSSTRDLEASGSNSVIPSWHKPEIVRNPVYIAAALMQWLRSQYIDFIIIEPA